jgi:hypothetical protein
MDVTHSHLVGVSADVLEGLDIVWLSGQTNMMDMREVQEQAYIEKTKYPLCKTGYKIWYNAYSVT